MTNLLGSATGVGLRCQDARKAFGRQDALTGATFDCPSGTVTALIGPNGAGKSTLFRAVSGLVALDAGSITVRGHPAGSIAAARNASSMPEQPDLYPGVSVREHLVFVALLYRLSRWHDRADRLLERFGLTDRTDALPHQLSQGMRRRLALVMALLRGSNVLLLDEPFNGLDPRNSAELRTLVRELADDGASVLVATHVLSDVSRLADRSVVLASGRVVAEGPPEHLRQAAGMPSDAGFEDVYLALTADGSDPAGFAAEGPAERSIR